VGFFNWLKSILRSSDYVSRGIPLGIILDVLEEAESLVSIEKSSRGERKSIRYKYVWINSSTVLKKKNFRITYTWCLEHQMNPHIIITGSSGSGKSSLLKSFLWDLRKVYNVKLLIIDFHGEYTELVLAMSGRVIDLSKQNLNPFSTLSINNPESPDERIQDFVETLRVVYPELGSVQIGIAIDILRKLFIYRGIRSDDPITWRAPGPTYQDFLNAIERLCRSRSSQRIIDAASTLKLRLETLRYVFNYTNSIDLDLFTKEEVLSLDLSSIPSDEAKNFLAEWILRKLFRYRVRKRVKESRLTYIAIDEAHRIASEDRTSILETIARESRKYGLGLLLVTQRLKDLSSSIRSNTATKIIGRTDDIEDLEILIPILYGAKEATSLKIPSLGKFEAVIIDTRLAKEKRALHIAFIPYFKRKDIVQEIEKIRKIAESLQIQMHRSIEYIKKTKIRLPRVEEVESIGYGELPLAMKRVLKAIKELNLYTANEIAEVLGLARPTVARYLRKLYTLGYLDRVELYTLSLSRKGRTVFYIPRESRESALHRILVEDIKKYLLSQGYSVNILGSSGAPDLELYIADQRIAIEIETGRKRDSRRLVKMISSRLSQGYDTILIVAPNDVVKLEIEKKLARYRAFFGSRLAIITHLEIPKILKVIA